MHGHDRVDGAFEIGHLAHATGFNSRERQQGEYSVFLDFNLAL